MTERRRQLEGKLSGLIPLCVVLGLLMWIASLFTDKWVIGRWVGFVGLIMIAVVLAMVGIAIVVHGLRRR